MTLVKHSKSTTAAYAGRSPHKNMVWVPGGTFLMGSNDFYPEERPVHRVFVDGFWMDKHTVTNAQFRRFVKSTGHITVAEHPPDPADYPGAQPKMLVPGSVVFRQPSHRVNLRNHYNWWDYVPGANWRHPEGPDSTLHGRERHPVVHVAYEDVAAYANWVGKELPTVRADGARRVVPTERLRLVRRDGKRLGMDDGLVLGSTPDRKCLLRQRQPDGGRQRAELRPADARHAHPAQGDQGRLVPVRA